MSTPHISLSSLSSFGQKFLQFVDIDKVMTKIILHSFFRHSVVLVHCTDV